MVNRSKLAGQIGFGVDQTSNIKSNIALSLKVKDEFKLVQQGDIDATGHLSAFFARFDHAQTDVKRHLK